MNRALGRLRRCPDCHQPVIVARTEGMNWQLLNPDPDPDGNVHAYQSNGNWIARSVPPRTPAHAPDLLMMPHKATCTEKPPRPAPRKMPDNVTSISDWVRKRPSRVRDGRR